MLTQVITNNPKMREIPREGEIIHINLLWQEGGLGDVLKRARDLVHQGWRLLNHPLASSLKPNQTPYKTLILSQGTDLDSQSLRVLEGAIAMKENLGTFSGGEELIMEDLQTIELEACKEVLFQIKRGVWL